jgi:predicted nucleic-acid-binding protein
VLVAADTNVVVRVLVSDDAVQQRAVVARLERIEASGGRVLLPHVVLAEVGWVLESAYAYRRADVVRALAMLVSTPPFVPEDPALVADALAIAAASSADWSDCMVLATSRAHQASTLLTFDRKLLRMKDCERP